MRIKHPYPALPDINSPVSRMVWESIYSSGVVSNYMTMASDAKKTKWGHPERLVVSEVVADPSPIPGCSDTAVRLLNGQTLHIALRDQDGDLHALSSLQQNSRSSEMQGMIVPDAKGRLWICGEPGQATFTGEEKLVRMLQLTSPMMKEAESARRGKPFDLASAAPLAGTMRFGFTLDSLGRDVRSGLDMTAQDKRSLERIHDRLEIILTREDAIARIIGPHLTDASLSRLVPDMSADLPDGLIPPHSKRARADFEDAFLNIATGLLADLRDAGLLEACPNNGPREVGSLAAWNAFLEGRLDGELEFEERLLRQNHLSRSPAISLMHGIIIDIAVKMDEILAAENGVERTQGQKDLVPASRIPELFAMIREQVLEIFSKEEDLRFHYSSDGLQGRSDGQTYVLAGSFLKPVLALRPNDIMKDPVPLPPIEEPKHVRHLEMDMPSGVLVMADWLRVPGFTEGIKALADGDDHDIGHAKGLDDRARAYFEKAGICIVQVGNSSPHCIDGGDGIWRMGRLDEDHDAFWVDEVKAPETLWSTCTDLWANIFADREHVLDVMQASGEYADREAATEALRIHAEKTPQVTIVDLGVSRLHLYAPTGAGIHKHDFNAVFSAPEIGKTEWMEDFYILSARPLTVDPECVEESGWPCKALNTPMTTTKPHMLLPIPSELVGGRSSD